MLTLKQNWMVLKDAFGDFLADNAMSWAAAIAFYTALSFAPIVLLLVSISGWLGADTQESLIDQAENVMGEQAGGVIQTVVENAKNNPEQGITGFIVGLAVTLFSASGVFGQLQVALNSIWEVKAAPGAGVWEWLRKRLLSMGMVGVLAFMLLVSLVASAILGYVLPQWESLGRAASILISLLIITPLFMVMFKFLPDVKVAWRDVIFGAVVTAILFLVGRTAIGLYLSYSAVGSAYGAAGSLVILLVWVYYSAIIVLLGAELTQSRARVVGRSIEPSKHAQRDDSAALRRDRPEPAAG